MLLKKFSLNGMAHITGGGFIENIPRMMPEGLGAELNKVHWELPPVFQLMEKMENLSGQRYIIYLTWELVL